jgi:hypothetical protein
VADLLAGGHLRRRGPVAGSEVVRGGEPADAGDLGDKPPGDDRADPEQLAQASAVVFDHPGDLGTDSRHLAVQDPDVGQVAGGQLATDLPATSRGRIPARTAAALPALSSRRRPPGVSSASSRCSRHRRLSPRRDKLLAPVAQQPQGHQRIVGGHRQDTGGFQGRQADGDRVIAVGLAAVAAGVHPDPCRQLRGHVHHRLAVGDQVLGQ